MDVYICAKPFLLFLKAFGLFALPVKRVEKKENQSCIGCLISFFSFCVLSYIIVINVNETLLKNVWNVSLMVGLVSLLIMMIYQWKKTNMIDKFLIQLSNFDEQVALDCLTNS